MVRTKCQYIVSALSTVIYFESVAATAAAASIHGMPCSFYSKWPPETLLCAWKFHFEWIYASQFCTEREKLPDIYVCNGAQFSDYLIVNAFSGINRS